MCCLFGLIDTELRFTGKEKSKMLHALASASEMCIRDSFWNEKNMP